MKFHSSVVFLMGAMIASCTHGQQDSQVPRKWRATVKVVDEEGVPIPGANVTIGFYVAAPAGQSIGTDIITGQSDSLGNFSASHEDRSVDLSFGVWKQEYYKSTQTYELGMQYQYDPVKWSPGLTFILKKVINPIPMYAKRVNLSVPLLNQRVGFDLKARDWVTPYGKGTQADLLFKADLQKRAADDYDYKLLVTESRSFTAPAPVHSRRARCVLPTRPQNMDTERSGSKLRSGDPANP